MSAVSLTPQVSRLVDTYHLGAPYTEFQALPEKHSRLHFTVTSCITYLIIGSFTLLIAVSAIASLFDGSTYDESGALFSLTILLIFVLGLLVDGDSKTIIKTWTIYVCPQGLLGYEAKTQAARAIEWKQIKDFYVRTWGDGESIPESEVFRRWKGYDFLLKCSDGTTFKFRGRSDRGTTDIGTLKHIIEKELISLHLPPLLEAFNEGKVVTFGAISLNQTGVSNGQYLFTWDKILSIDFAGESIYVREFQWDVSFSVPKTSVPNACVLEALVKRLSSQGSIDIAAPIYMTASEKRFSRKAQRFEHHRNS